MNTILPEGFTARAPRPEDLQQVYEFVQMCEIAENGEPNNTFIDIEEKWQRPNFNLATDATLVLAPGGEIAGYGVIMNRTKPALTLSSYCSPAYYTQGVGDFLLDRLEEIMSQAISQFDPSLQITFNSWISSNNDEDQRLLEARGYFKVREFMHMGIKFSDAPAGAAWPEGITVRTFVPGQDEQAMYEAYETTFGDHWGHIRVTFEEYARNNFNRKKFDPSLWFLATETATGEIAGYSCCSIEEDLCWINLLGVKRNYRRSGLGWAILQHSFQKFYERGKLEVRLVVDGQSLTGATRLYTRAGMEPIVRFLNYEKVIRPGIVLGVTELAD